MRPRRRRKTWSSRPQSIPGSTTRAWISTPCRATSTRCCARNPCCGPRSSPGWRHCASWSATTAPPWPRACAWPTACWCSARTVPKTSSSIASATWLSASSATMRCRSTGPRLIWPRAMSTSRLRPTTTRPTCSAPTARPARPSSPTSCASATSARCSMARRCRARRVWPIPWPSSS